MMEALAMMIALLTLLVAGLTLTALRSGSRSEERIPVRVRRPDRSSD